MQAAGSLALAVVLLAGCASPASCFIGFNFLPPSPVLICGVDANVPGEE